MPNTQWEIQVSGSCAANAAQRLLDAGYAVTLTPWGAEAQGHGLLIHLYVRCGAPHMKIIMAPAGVAPPYAAIMEAERSIN